MAWPFLHVQRDCFQSPTPSWGTLFMIDSKGKWNRFSYSYELPWHADAHGHSKSKISCIEIGTYELIVRTDGNKGWRLELQGTGHRVNIQVHRAHKSMYIEGCILPVHVHNLKDAGLKVGDKIIQTQSVALVKQIRERYEELAPLNKGNPTICISALLPPMIDGKTATA